MLQGKLSEPGLGREAAVMRLEPHVWQVEQEPGARRVEEAAQPYGLRHLAGAHIEETGDVFHDERLVEARLEGVGVRDEPRKKLFRVERWEDVVKIVCAVLCVQALKVLGHPGRVVQRSEGAGPFDGAIVERLRALTRSEEHTSEL